jgi:hypothetical protein
VLTKLNKRRLNMAECYNGDYSGVVWKCNECGLKFCGSCAADKNYGAGNAKCPKCDNWTSSSES